MTGLQKNYTPSFLQRIQDTLKGFKEKDRIVSITTQIKKLAWMNLIIGQQKKKVVILTNIGLYKLFIRW